MQNFVTILFIAMGTTINDFLNPEFVLMGIDDKDAAEIKVILQNPTRQRGV